jgi:hypothetical protein
MPSGGSGGLKFRKCRFNIKSINSSAMENKEICILGIHISDSVRNAELIQPVLTKFGCTIRTRLGLHDVAEEFSSSTGMMILELTGDPKEYVKLENELLKIEGLEVKKMVFNG